MIVECTNCLAKFKFDDAKLSGVSHKNVRCSKCGQIFAVMSENAQQQVKQTPNINVAASPSHIPTNNMPAMQENIAPNKIKPPSIGKSPDNLAVNGLSTTLRKKPAKAKKKLAKSGLSPQNVGALKPDFSTVTDLHQNNKNEFTVPDTLASKPESSIQMPNEMTFEAPDFPVEPLETGELKPPALEKEKALPKNLAATATTANTAATATNDDSQLIPNESTQKKINDEYYKSDEITLERSPELDVLKEILFGDDANGLGVADAERGKKKQKFIQRDLSGERIENAHTRSKAAITTTLLIKMVLIVMMLMAAFVSYKMLSEGEEFNYAQLGITDSFDSAKQKIESLQE